MYYADIYGAVGAGFRRALWRFPPGLARQDNVSQYSGKVRSQTNPPSPLEDVKWVLRRLTP
ncbi:hypothetical protein C7B77_17835 [Chamaesiphon polymorphus CCALA 037]|uniref:Uncharacterized protein n=1 Tax=Chamaesiphon polymorphus CCALA 037 TaxID=2107692 RepID=A0A2T1GB70_9CYAN|nr:hypothetical protein C7B77_17835 [Chamaesiphon polymorphus CCALA 037]